jgi:hypothetical protein
VLRSPYRENDRAATEATSDGHIKVITDRDGDILGATIVGAKAGENIASWALAVDQKLNIGAVAALVAPYPTYSELGRQAALTYSTPGIDTLAAVSSVHSEVRATVPALANFGMKTRFRFIR